MIIAPPHYTLVAESAAGPTGGYWRFVLRGPDGDQARTAADFEPNVYGDRLELLVVIRGLEALRQPSRVTLVTPSDYVRRGLRYGLATWRDHDWMWERYGDWVPVKHRDLWQRVSGALDFHQLSECRRRPARSHRLVSPDVSADRYRPASSQLAMAATG